MGEPPWREADGMVLMAKIRISAYVLRKKQKKKLCVGEKLDSRMEDVLPMGRMVCFQDLDFVLGCSMWKLSSGHARIRGYIVGVFDLFVCVCVLVPLVGFCLKGQPQMFNVQCPSRRMGQKQSYVGNFAHRAFGLHAAIPSPPSTCH